MPENKKLTTWQSLKLAFQSKRTASVSLLSFSSGLPLGLVWIAIPDWLRSIGADIRFVGLISLAQLPWTYKILWAPFVDRYSFPFLGRRRGWMAVMQIALFVSLLFLAGVGHHPDTPWVVGALALTIAFFSATQDIAIDAYAVEVLKKEEQGAVVGARVAMYRAAMFVAGGGAISVAGHYSWPVANLLLGLLFLPMLILTSKSPEPEEYQPPPKSLNEAVLDPLREVLSRKKAWAVLGFVLTYKLADNLAGSLLRPFLVDLGYSNDDRGFAVGVVALTSTIIATFLGGLWTNSLGLKRALWIFGIFQTLATVGYIAVARVGTVHRPLMYGAVALEMIATSLGTGAFSVYLLRITSKKFAATQYALFSVLFALPRTFAGPISGYMLSFLGCVEKRCSPHIWETFLWYTIPSGVFGLMFLWWLTKDNDELATDTSQ